MTIIRISEETAKRLNDISIKEFRMGFSDISKDYLIKSILDKL